MARQPFTLKAGTLADHGGAHRRTPAQSLRGNAWHRAASTLITTASLPDQSFAQAREGPSRKAATLPTSLPIAQRTVNRLFSLGIL